MSSLFEIALCHQSLQVSAKILFKISSIILNLPANVESEAGKTALRDSLRTLCVKYSGRLPEMHPVRDMKLQNYHLDALMTDVDAVKAALESYKPSDKIENFDVVYEKFKVIYLKRLYKFP